MPDPFAEDISSSSVWDVSSSNQIGRAGRSITSIGGVLFISDPTDRSLIGVLRIPSPHLQFTLPAPCVADMVT